MFGVGGITVKAVNISTIKVKSTP